MTNIADEVTDEVLVVFNELCQQVRFESPRGKIIIIACVIEDTLITLLKDRLPQNTSSDLITDQKNSPINDFYTKSIIAHAIGCITDDEFHDIQIIRKMRNQLAHKLDADLNSDSFKDLIGNLRHMPTEEPCPNATIVDKAVAATLYLQSSLIVRTIPDHQTRISPQSLKRFPTP